MDPNLDSWCGLGLATVHQPEDEASSCGCSNSLNTSRAPVLTIGGHTFSQTSTLHPKRLGLITHCSKSTRLGDSARTDLLHKLLSAELNPGIHLLIQQIFVERLSARLTAMRKKSPYPCGSYVPAKEAQNEFTSSSNNYLRTVTLGSQPCKK